MVSSKSRRPSTPSVSTSTLISDVASKFTEVPRKVTKELLLSFMGSVESHVASGCKVRIDKLGILAVKDRAARKGRNPQTGEEIHIPATKKVSFRVSSSLKEAVGIKKKKSMPTTTSKTKKKK